MNQSYFKKAGIGLLVIGFYFFFSYMEGLPFLLLGIDVNTLSNAIKIPYLLIYQRSEEHTSELQSRFDLVCRLLLEKKKKKKQRKNTATTKRVSAQ